MLKKDPTLPFGFRVTQTFWPHVKWHGARYSADVGQYGGAQPSVATSRRVARFVPIACPYCERPLLLPAIGVSGRIVKILGEDADKRWGLQEPLPPTHEALICEPCAQVFTVLKDVLEASL